MRTFDTGATRSPLAGKPQYEGYLNPLVIKRFGEYMLKHQTQADGQRREPDNWQKGIPPESLMDSAWRHFMDVWLHHRGYTSAAVEPMEEALCGLLFNTMALLLHELEERPVMVREWRDLNDEAPEQADMTICTFMDSSPHTIGTKIGCMQCAAYRTGR